ncbi:hypothetical protein [Emticicia sp. BO119]|uniref:hypothetical protein n=1 Tax=Emticicia sp. BO119 TaxID=2757768 RepID=UPI0015F031F6|nr:hypothetical protein [Emticicia sp. BO119]MBA4849488.1 hypothetical protein [Emticicia sp. BO119]
MAKNVKWTGKLKKAASTALLGIANAYETKRRTRLVGVKFSSDGSAKWSGHAHNYTIWAEDLKPDSK